MTIILAVGLGMGAPWTHAQEGIKISDTQALAIGKRIWKNECAGTVAGLTSWNAGENFASLGINHYIWYPEGKTGPFEESFPRLAQFLAPRGVAVPGWVRAARGCPWSTRADFERDLHGERLSALRELLAKPEVVALQARFSADRLSAALPKMLQAAPDAERVRREFYRVGNSPGGAYALMDYVNFKGEGVSPSERYQGRGWGLLQVLEGMTEDGGPGPAATRQFAASAARVLTERVANAPTERNEGKWLPGWKSRVRSYAGE